MMVLILFPPDNVLARRFGYDAPPAKRGCVSKPDVGIIPRLSLSSPVVHGNKGSKVKSTRVTVYACSAATLFHPRSRRRKASAELG